MKLLLGSCVWPGATAELAAHGHGVVWVGNWPRDPGDEEILDDSSFPKATYHAFWGQSKGYASPNDGRPVCSALRRDFVWPKSAV